jgi:predicted metal-binding protein
MKGYVFAISFIGGSCKHCTTEECEAPCKNPTCGRIPLEAIGVNVIETCRQFNIEVEFPVERTGIIWRIGLLLVM